MSETCNPRSPRSTPEWLAKLASLLLEADMRPILAEDWGVFVSAWPPRANDFFCVPFELREGLLEVFHLGLAGRAGKVAIGRSRINGVILAWDETATRTPAEPSTTTGEIPIID